MLRKGDLTELRSPRYQEPKRRLILILLDASDSMEKVIESTRKAVINILKTGYVSRDEIALIYFQGKSAKVAIKPTRNAIYADEKLRRIRVHGSTPLATGLKKSIEFIKKIKNRYKNTVFVLISDGNTNISDTGNPIEDALKFARKMKTVADQRIFINPSPSLVETSRKIAKALGARYIELKSEEKTKDAFEKFLR